MRFVDTNILLYAISRDEEERDKAQRANGILDEGDLGLSVQVLQEFYVQATRSGRIDPLAHDQAVSLVESFMRFNNPETGSRRARPRSPDRRSDPPRERRHSRGRAPPR